MPTSALTFWRVNLSLLVWLKQTRQTTSRDYFLQGWLVPRKHGQHAKPQSTAWKLHCQKSIDAKLLERTVHRWHDWQSLLKLLGIYMASKMISIVGGREVQLPYAACCHLSKWVVLVGGPLVDIANTWRFMSTTLLGGVCPTTSSWPKWLTSCMCLKMPLPPFA